MKHPQTLAGRLAGLFPDKKLAAIKNYACCAFVLMWCLGIEPDDDVEAVMTAARMMDEGCIDSECTVYWIPSVRFLTGRDITGVKKQRIQSIMRIKERTPVFYKLKPGDSSGHWVGVENGRIAFNPLASSVCVDKGRPYEMRILEWPSSHT